MVHSTWGDWFVSDEVESTPPEGLSVWYLGCNGFVVRSPETTLYVDPYFGDGDPPGLVRMIPVPMDPNDATLADGVLVTHEHLDHMHPPSYAPLVGDCGATVNAPSASFDDPDYDGDLAVPDDARRIVEPGDTFDVGDLTVHVRGSHDPDAAEPVSYVVEHESGTFFHGGDSKPADAFKAIGREFDIDVGVLAFGSQGHVELEGGRENVAWYMNENEIVAAASDLRLDRLVPTHWDMWRGVCADPKALFELVASYEHPRRLEPVTIGDRVDVARSK
jgi:L-ascorbate 6-phosphate lactonase